MQNHQDHAEVTLALDVGGTFIKSGVFSEGVLLKELPQVPSRSDGTRDEIISAVRTAVAAAGSIDSLGIAIPGPFNFHTGISMMTHKFGALYGVDLKAELNVDVTPVFIHDANAFLLGELGYGALRGAERAGAITLGTGLGAAVAVDGETLNSELGSPSADVSLWKVPFRGGTAEDIISSRGLLKKYPAPDVKTMAGYAKQGDEKALRVWHEFGDALAELLSDWIARFRLEKVVVGGQIAKDWALFGGALSDLPIAPSALAGASLYGAYMRTKGKKL